MRFQFVFIFALLSNFVLAQSPNLIDHKTELKLLREQLLRTHFSPPAIQDSFSLKVYKDFFESLDSRKLYFIESDFAPLTSYQTKLDDEFQGDSWGFLPIATAAYKKALERVEAQLIKLENTPPDYKQKAYVYFRKTEDTTYIKDLADFERTWSKVIRYRTLQLLDTDSLFLSGTMTDAQFMAKEKELRLKVIAKQKRKIRRILDNPSGFENWIASYYFHSFASCFDSHSAYYAKFELDDFHANLSTEVLSFGIEWEENDNGEVIISRLTPGGPAWMSNALNEQDRLSSIQWQGLPAVDLSNADIEEAYAQLDAAAKGRMTLTVRKPSGELLSIELEKQKIMNDENVVKGYVLKGKRKIGYISLPGFYMQEDAGLGCSNDVAKEIFRLQSEGIEGLILDIRYNGGGYLHEGISLAGLFIPEGPMHLIAQTGGKVTLMKDPNRGVAYSGPLVVLVNGYSASASELLAGTLQDYNRAVIVGAPTFGKATGQGEVQLDSLVSPQVTPFGSATITRMKLYRITGASAQLKGVIPDIQLPDFLTVVGKRESDYPAVLPSDSTSKKAYYTPFAKLPIAELKERSAGRVASDSFFIRTRLLMTKLEYEQNKTDSIELSLKPYLVSVKESAAIDSQYESIVVSESNRVFTAQNHESDQALFQMDGFANEINQRLIQDLNEDGYIKECYLVLQDLIEQP
jgi:carboxyl-terminal processing protease